MRLIDADTIRYDQLLRTGNKEHPLEWAVSQSLINSMPTIDAAPIKPIKHGKWIPKITELGTMIFRCSACQKYNDVHWAYCPRCGAKMDGERIEDADSN